MTNTDWLYKLVDALDDIAVAAQAGDDVPNIAEWVQAIQQEERERCAEIAEQTIICGPHSNEEGASYYTTIPRWARNTIAAAIREAADDQE